MAGLGALARKLFGSANDRKIKTFRARVDEINALEPEVQALSDEALRARTEEFRNQLKNGASLDDLLAPAFATVREAARRALARAPLRRGWTVAGARPCARVVASRAAQGERGGNCARRRCARRG
ncbi:MAG: hypothetical protein AAFY05_09045, partial [Pseudomonadota bacterium]